MTVMASAGVTLYVQTSGFPLQTTYAVPAAETYNSSLVLGGDPAVQRQLAEFYDAQGGDDARVRLTTL